MHLFPYITFVYLPLYLVLHNVRFFVDASSVYFIFYAIYAFICRRYIGIMPLVFSVIKYMYFFPDFILV